MKSPRAHRLMFSMLTAILVLAFTAPMIAREPTTGHLIFGVVLLLACPTFVYLVGLASDFFRNKSVN